MGGGRTLNQPEDIFPSWMCITAGSPDSARRVRVIRVPTHLFPDAVRDQRVFFAQSHFLFSTETSMLKRLGGGACERAILPARAQQCCDCRMTNWKYLRLKKCKNVKLKTHLSRLFSRIRVNTSRDEPAGPSSLTWRHFLFLFFS